MPPGNNGRKRSREEARRAGGSREDLGGAAGLTALLGSRIDACCPGTAMVERFGGWLRAREKGQLC